MAGDTEIRVHNILGQLRSLDKARELFSELNYDPAHDPISQKGWGEAIANTLAEDPQIIARHDDFKIIYTRLDSDGLLLGDERPIVNRLLKECPYLLCLFSDRQQQRNRLTNQLFDIVWIKDKRVLAVTPRPEFKPFFDLQYEALLQGVLHIRPRGDLNP